MLKAAPMRQVDLIVLERDVDRVTECLGKLGLVEPKPVDTTVTLSHMGVESTMAGWAQIEARCASLAENIPEETPLAQAESPPLALAAAQALVDEWDTQCGQMREKLRELTRNEERLRAARQELAGFAPIPASMENIQSGQFLHFAVGSMDPRVLEQFTADREGAEILLPFRTDSGEDKLIALTTRKGRWALESELQEAGFQPDAVSSEHKGVPREILDRIDNELAETTLAARDLRYDLKQFFVERGAAIVALRERARNAQQFYTAQSKFARTERTCLISGWARESSIPQIERALTDATLGRILIEHRPPDPDADIPVFIENPKWLKPFERLIEAYGVPGYYEIEPTIFVAISFLLMFGIMFGDVGHGAVVALAGLAMLKVPKLAAKFEDTGVIFVAAGLSAMFFGFLFGSVFASEDLLPALWMRPLRHIPELMIGAVVFGVLLMSLGIVLNVINCLRKRDYYHAFLDKFGVVGALFYWGSLGLVLKQVCETRNPVTPVEVGIVAGVPLLILFLRTPLFNLLTRKKHLFEEGVGLYLMESLVEVLETFSSFVGNTASFVRISAFALAHVGLSIAVFVLADVLSHMPGGGFWYGMTIVLGNVFIILLEGIVVSIQSLRLLYYEFFGKFFRAEGRKFEPFQMT